MSTPLFQVLRCKDCGRLMTKTQMEFKKCECGGLEGEPTEATLENLTPVEHTQFLSGSLYVLCSHEFLRCNRPLCDRLILERHIKAGGCPCGSHKVRGINLNGSFTPEEWVRVLNGEAHSYDPKAIAVDPDVLNKDNPDYWNRIREEVPAEVFKRRWEVANAS